MSFTTPKGDNPFEQDPLQLSLKMTHIQHSSQQALEIQQALSALLKRLNLLYNFHAYMTAMAAARLDREGLEQCVEQQARFLIDLYRLVKQVDSMIPGIPLQGHPRGHGGSTFPELSVEEVMHQVEQMFPAPFSSSSLSSSPSPTSPASSTPGSADSLSPHDPLLFVGDLPLPTGDDEDGDEDEPPFSSSSERR